ncbi:MAG: acyl carrier protein [Rhodospirillales bacterium]|nr:acyl carrier protein [Rhodospirillales bacterium]
MDRQETLNQLISVMGTVLDIKGIVVGEETNAYDVDGWDSLSHARFVLAVEQHFQIRFPGDLLFDMENIGDMLEAIIDLLKAANG